MKTINQLVEEVNIKEIVLNTINQEAFKEVLKEVVLDCVTQQIKEQSKKLVEKELSKVFGTEMVN